jgi:hypothetical protein
LLATIGLLGCEPRADAVAPLGIESQPEGEPSGRADAAKSGALAGEAAGIPESREWCGAIIDTRPRPLLRTSSFLLAWNEIRIADGRAPAGPIPLNELDARLTICGSPTCDAAVPRPIEFNNAGRISIGTAIAAGDGELLVVPDLSPFFGPNQCAGVTQMSAQRVGEFLQVTAVAEPRPYAHHHGYYGYVGGCYGAQGRHDVFIHVATGTMELEIEHRGAVLGVRATDKGRLNVTLTGCNDKLELAWTE